MKKYRYEVEVHWFDAEANLVRTLDLQEFNTEAAAEAFANARSDHHTTKGIKNVEWDIHTIVNDTTYVVYVDISDKDPSAGGSEVFEAAISAWRMFHEVVDERKASNARICSSRNGREFELASWRRK